MITSQQNNKLLEEWKRHSGISDLLSVIEDLKTQEVHFKIPKISFSDGNQNPVTEFYSNIGIPAFFVLQCG